VKGRPMVTRVLVDMSLTSLHHGHIRLLQKASLLGYVVVALCSDDEILKAKGFLPLLSFEHRKEIALAIRYVEEVIECEWLIDEAYLDFHNIDLLVHGDDNVNPVPSERLVLFPKTGGISSTILSNREDS
jgi:glycerol-3-phosphate cytidylyltransferase